MGVVMTESENDRTKRLITKMRAVSKECNATIIGAKQFRFDVRAGVWSDARDEFRGNDDVVFVDHMSMLGPSRSKGRKREAGQK